MENDISLDRNNSFLIDECLTPKLVAAAHIRGYDATHVTFLQGRRYTRLGHRPSDSDRDDIFVTNNARDFLQLYARLEIHPGLVIIFPAVKRAPQIELFTHVLDFIEQHPDVMNKLVQIDSNGSITFDPWSNFDDSE